MTRLRRQPRAKRAAGVLEIDRVDPATGKQTTRTFVGFYPAMGILLAEEADGTRCSVIGEPALGAELAKCARRGKPVPRTVAVACSQAEWQERPGWPTEWEGDERDGGGSS